MAKLIYGSDLPKDAKTVAVFEECHEAPRKFPPQGQPYADDHERDPRPGQQVAHEPNRESEHKPHPEPEHKPEPEREHELGPEPEHERDPEPEHERDRARRDGPDKCASSLDGRKRGCAAII